MTQVFGQAPTSAAIETILALTQNHTYYVNLLCARLTRQEQLFTVGKVETAWHDYALEEKSTIFKELEGLSQNQFKLLTAFARFGPIKTPQGDKFLQFAGMALSSTRQALKVLLEKDYLYQDREHAYHVLDPLIHYVLRYRP